MEDFKITSSRDKKEQTQIITFEGDLSIFNAEKIQKKLKRRKIDSERIEVVLKNIQGFDLSSLQMILSLQKTQEARSGEFHVKAVIPEAKTTLLAQTGFENIIHQWK